MNANDSKTTEEQTETALHRTTAQFSEESIEAIEDARDQLLDDAPHAVSRVDQTEISIIPGFEMPDGDSEQHVREQLEDIMYNVTDGIGSAVSPLAIEFDEVSYRVVLHLENKWDSVRMEQAEFVAKEGGEVVMYPSGVKITLATIESDRHGSARLFDAKTPVDEWVESIDTDVVMKELPEKLLVGDVSIEER